MQAVSQDVRQPESLDAQPVPVVSPDVQPELPESQDAEPVPQLEQVELRADSLLARTQPESQDVQPVQAVSRDVQPAPQPARAESQPRERSDGRLAEQAFPLRLRAQGLRL